MTKDEKNLIYNALRRNAPGYFDKLMQKVNQKREMILTCIEIASNGNDDGYQDEVNRLYNTCCSLMNKTETYMLNYICLIKHKEQFNDRQNDDTDIRKWSVTCRNSSIPRTTRIRQIPLSVYWTNKHDSSSTSTEPRNPLEGRKEQAKKYSRITARITTQFKNVLMTTESQSKACTRD